MKVTLTIARAAAWVLMAPAGSCGRILPGVGGMAGSLITLFIVPCVFCAIEEWKCRRTPPAQAT
jgi:hypothetical protein